MVYYAVCNANGPISVELGSTLDDALAAWEALDGRRVIDDAKADVEDALGIAGACMSETEFDAAMEDSGAEFVRELGEVDQHGRTMVGDWYLWVVEL